MSKPAKENEHLTGKGFTSQSHALIPKIEEVDRYLRSPDRAQHSIYEVHPEVSFAAMKAQRGMPGDLKRLPIGHEMRHPKKTLAGVVERRALLREFFLNRFDELEGEAPKHDFGRHAALDDFYDALACLWTARRIQKGTEGPARALCGVKDLRNLDIRKLSESAPKGADGLPMRIVY